jgi:protein TonB
LGRVLIISALVHVVLLVVVPRMPALKRDDTPGLQVYTVELMDVPATAPEPPSEVKAPEPTKSETPKVEEPIRDAIPEKKPARKQVAKKPPSEPQPTLEERLAQRLKEQDAKRPEAPSREETGVRPAASAATGRATVSATRFPYAWYLSVVQGKVSSNWTQPSARLIAEDSLTVVVSFRIRRDGSIDAVSVRRSSGRTTLDDSATKAIRSSAPFPPLPDDYRDSSLDVTIDFTVTR